MRLLSQTRKALELRRKTRSCCHTSLTSSMEDFVRPRGRWGGISRAEGRATTAVLVVSCVSLFIVSSLVSFPGIGGFEDRPVSPVGVQTAAIEHPVTSVSSPSNIKLPLVASIEPQTAYRVNTWRECTTQGPPSPRPPFKPISLCRTTRHRPRISTMSWCLPGTAPTPTTSWA